MSNGLAKDIEWTKDYEAWQFAYCFIVFQQWINQSKIIKKSILE